MSTKQLKKHNPPQSNILLKDRWMGNNRYNLYHYLYISKNTQMLYFSTVRRVLHLIFLLERFFPSLSSRIIKTMAFTAEARLFKDPFKECMKPVEGEGRQAALYRGRENVFMDKE